MLGDALPDLARVVVGRLHEDGPAGTSPLSGAGAEDRRRVVDADQVDLLELAVHEDVRVGDRQVIGGRQALLLRAVLGIGLHVLAEDVAGDGGDDLVGGDRAEAADRVAAHREAARGPEVGVVGALQRQGMVDADAEVVLAVVHHVVERGDDVGRAARRGCPGRPSRRDRSAGHLLDLDPARSDR